MKILTVNRINIMSEPIPGVLEHIENLQKYRKAYVNGEYGKMPYVQFRDRMFERFPEVFNTYPMISDKTLQGFFDTPEEFNRLKMAMGIIDKTNSGTITQEEGEKTFGQHLVDSFVTPNLEDKDKDKNAKKQKTN
jgi:hypothetical protein